MLNRRSATEAICCFCKAGLEGKRYRGSGGDGRASWCGFDRVGGKLSAAQRDATQRSLRTMTRLVGCRSG
jgi:hypothetical protein